MHKEDAIKAEIQKQKQKEAQVFIKNYLEERTRWKETEKQKVAEEMAQIAAWNKKMEDRLNAIKAAKIEKAGNQEEIFKRVTAEIEANRRQREESEQLLLDLFVEEKEAAAREAERKKEEKREALKVEMTVANEKAKQYKAAQVEKERAEEEAYRVQLMQKFAEDARLEQMSKQKRHEKQIEYRKTVDQLVADRRVLYEKEKEMERQAAEEQAQQERYRKTVIEQERRRLLLEHAAALRDFLPRSLMKTKEEVELVFGSDFVKEFGYGDAK